MKNILLPILGLALLWSNISLAQDNMWSSARPDGHAPISVMGDHYHHKGGVMFTYRYMPMWMNGNLSSSNEVSNDEIYENFMVAPEEMRMDMHMLGGMYAPADFLTIAFMANYISNTMDLRTRMNMDFTTESSGFGDLSITGLIKILNRNQRSLHANLGMSIPTGNIDQRDATPMSADAQLAYPMQLGSGTWDPSIGLTYLGQTDRISWGLQPKYKFRIGENTENYTLGNRIDIVGWGAVKVADFLSFSASVSYFDIDQISGADPDLNPMMMPLFNTLNSGRSQWDVGLGSNFYIPSGILKDLRLAVEVKIPISHMINGIQMENTLMGTLGIQYNLGHSCHQD